MKARLFEEGTKWWHVVVISAMMAGPFLLILAKL